MKRDMELVRNLLFYFEDKEINSEIFEQYPDDEIIYHLSLMGQAGLLSGEPVKVNAPKKAGSYMLLSTNDIELTWEGHDFLDAARNESVWKKSMGKVAESGGAFTFDVLKAVLIATVKEQLGL